MKKTLYKPLRASFGNGLAFIMLFALLLSGCQKLNDFFDVKQDHLTVLPGDFKQTNLVSNTGEFGAVTVDPLLVNSWGLAFSSGGTPWISNEGSGTTTIYNSEGVPLPISPIAIPSPHGLTGGHPTGVVFNGSATDFMLSNGQPARFIFVGDDGVLSGWNQPAGDKAIQIRHNSNAVYTGLALNWSGGKPFLFAANFKEAKIDVFSSGFHKVTNKPFNDPYLPDGYAPFNIQSIGDRLYVAYAKVGANGDEEKGVGNGYVDVYNTDGVLLQRFASKGLLNAPWGVAQVPDGFLSGDNAKNAILVGNFGDGRINAYSWDGKFMGQLRMNGKTLVIDGLWALMFPPTTSPIDPMRLYFTAGPENEKYGLFGYILKK